MTATESATIRLANRRAACTIAPALGGSILRLVVDGIDILRPAPDDTRDILAVASFPLLPFANRIGHGSFRFGDEDVLLSSDPVGAPHALHGHGWRSAWNITSRGDDRAVLAFDHPAGDWPWAYRATQSIVLREDGLGVRIAIENRDPARAMPAGVGLHPYFVRSTGSRVAAPARSIWNNDATGLAVTEAADTRLAVPGGATVDTLEGCDNWFACPAPAIVTLPSGGTVEISGDLAGHHVYVPAGETAFCVEPTTHAPDSFGRGEITDGDIIAPGASRRWTFQILLRA